jgi:phytoene dehydrogenase-like protein
MLLKPFACTLQHVEASVSDPDYVVVGSGLSALAFGALMARSGRKVVVLEAHEKPGGYAHTFEMGPYRFNAQLHYVWNAGAGRTVGRFLAKLGLQDEVPFVQLDSEGYDHMRMPGYSLDIPYSYPELTRRLQRLFPTHAAELEAFVDEVRLTDEEMESLPASFSQARQVLGGHGYRRLLRYRNATLQDVFDRFALPRKAQTLIALQWPDFLLPPAQLSFFLWLKLFCGYARGAYYPKHHFEHVVETLVRALGAHGGGFRPRCKVVAFLREGERVSGVRVEHVDASGVGLGEFEDVTGREVVCNMDPQQAAHMIGLEHFSPGIRARLQYDYSASSFVAYLAVKDMDLREHGFGAWNVFHSEGADLNAAFEAMNERGDYSNISFAMSTPTLISDEPGAAPPGHQILELLTVASHDRFLEAKLGDAHAYRDQKQHILDAMLDVVERDYAPGIRGHLAIHVLGSPTTSERYVRAPQGNSYGAVMTPARVWRGRLDHRSSIAGLHFCNASSGFPGFAGTVWTGSRLYEHLSGDRFLE